MKRVTAIAMALMMVVAFTACGGQEEEAAATTQYEKTGVVQSVGDGSITILTNADEELTFDISNAEIDAGTEIQVDDVAIVFYSGEIVDGDTSGCTVYEVSVQPGEEHEIKGKLVTVGENEGTITVDVDGQELTFDITEAERHYKNGIKVGNEITLKYTGVIKGRDTSRANVTVVIDTDENKTKDKATVEVKAVNETVWTTATVNVRTGSSSQTEVVVTLKKGTKLTRTGILSDGWSRVTYKGKDEYIASQFLTTKDPAKQKKESTESTTQKSTATTAKPSTTAEPTTTTAEPTTVTEEPTATTEEPPAVNKLEGTIAEGTSIEDSILIVITPDGQDLTFHLTGKEQIDVTGGALVGLEITMEYEGDIVDTDTSGVTITHIYQNADATDE